ncbi:hypothetical protein [Candidatus Tisiphia endosymbiont of Xenochironomus xenolabis]
MVTLKILSTEPNYGFVNYIIHEHRDKKFQKVSVHGFLLFSYDK